MKPQVKSEENNNIAKQAYFLVDYLVSWSTFLMTIWSTILVDLLFGQNKNRTNVVFLLKRSFHQNPFFSCEATKKCFALFFLFLALKSKLERMCCWLFWSENHLKFQLFIVMSWLATG